MRNKTLKTAIILFGLSLVFAASGLVQEDFKLFGHIDNDLHLTLENRLSADINGVKAQFKDTIYKYESNIELTDFEFTALAFEWEQKTPAGTHIDMEVRFFNGFEWTKWNKAAIESQQPAEENEFYPVYSIINTNPSESFQYKITLESNSKEITPEFKNIKFTYINANDDKIRKKPNVLSSYLIKPSSKINKAYLKQNGIKYISRSEWGANESLRLYTNDNPEPILVNLSSDFYIRFAKELKLQKVIKQTKEGKELTWPLQYPTKIEKIILHHTATTNDLNDPKKAIRDIYYYHAIAKGWGDIGYNYIIDQEGNVYEGRYGGEGVVGAHAGPGNRGSIGIAILGNYNDENLNPKAQKALEALISEKTRQHQIDPMGNSYFRGVKQPNIMGHGNVMHTSCPGDNLKKLLPHIRRNVLKLNGSQKYLANGNDEFRYIPTLEEIKMKPDKKMEYVFKLQNTGNETWTKKTRISFINDDITKNAFLIQGSNPKETTVEPGEYGTFKLKIRSRMKGGFYYLNLKPVINGKTPTKASFYVPIIVEEPKFAYEIVNIKLPKSLLKAGEKIIGTVALKNTGNVKWSNYGTSRISLGTDNPKDRISTFTKSTRMGYMQESTVKPGEIGHFVFNLKAPNNEGLYQEYFAPVVESIAWISGENMKLTLNVKT